MRRLYAIKLRHLADIIRSLRVKGETPDGASQLKLSHEEEAALLDELEKELQEARLHHDHAERQEGGE